jgi:hypothetical protein
MNHHVGKGGEGEQRINTHLPEPSGLDAEGRAAAYLLLAVLNSSIVLGEAC